MSQYCIDVLVKYSIPRTYRSDVNFFVKVAEIQSAIAFEINPGHLSEQEYLGMSPKRRDYLQNL